MPRSTKTKTNETRVARARASKTRLQGLKKGLTAEVKELKARARAAAKSSTGRDQGQTVARLMYLADRKQQAIGTLSQRIAELTARIAQYKAA